jgi:glycosyltransferase involved in cell wall biosynthesis
MLSRYYFLFLSIFSSIIMITYGYSAKIPSTKSPLDAFICISSEDEKYNVKGGIGTYLGILTKEVKKIYPEMKVYWITKSHNSTDFSEKDAYGIERHYLSDTNPYQNRPFCKLLGLTQGEGKALLEQEVFLNKANSKLAEILAQLENKKVAIECGEWEGIAHQVFRVLDNKNILRAARIHTPLAVTMVSNDLPVSTTNKLQLIHEFETLHNVDCISSCTSYMKSQVTQHVLGNESETANKIIVIPNPVDSNNYKPGSFSRISSINKVNQLLQYNFINETTYNIYFIGSVETRKGAELAIGSIAKIATKLPNSRFIFFGHHGGNDSKNLTANTKLSPHILYKRIPEEFRHQVAFAGYVDHAELPAIIESGDVFPIMYLGDNFPGTVAEIALMEKPILALSRGGLNEMLRDEDGNFVAYDLGSSLDGASDKLAQGILDLHLKPEHRSEMGKNLGHLIRNKYDPAKISREIIEFYSTSLLKKS